MIDHVHFRAIRQHELPALLDLYRHLHATDAPLPPDDVLRQLWDAILHDPKLYYFVADRHGDLVASCTLVIIPNLTRGGRPYGVIENVVTHPAHRRKGIGTCLLRYALDTAWEHNCYKVMLLTGRKETHEFYRQAGFSADSKTGFVATSQCPVT